MTLDELEALDREARRSAEGHPCPICLGMGVVDRPSFETPKQDVRSRCHACRGKGRMFPVLSALIVDAVPVLLRVARAAVEMRAWLLRAYVDQASERTWCQICRTEKLWPNFDGDGRRHDHAHGCIVDKSSAALAVLDTSEADQAGERR